MTLLAYLWSFVLLLTTPGAPAGQTSQATPPQASGYVGQETCVGCHDTEGESIQKTLHGKAQNPHTPAATQGCENCHGPGAAHVDDPSKPDSIRRFPTMKPRDVSDTCLTCHTRGDHTQWKGSMHDARNLSCITCHSVHNPKSEKGQLKTASITSTCAVCHTTEVAKQQRQGHMPVREGKMECTSCHNPHGTTSVRMLRTGNWVNEACTGCHAEKRGPFLWDHAPVREACSTCHDPHGSNNDRMLIAKLPILCQSCHIGTKHPSTIYDSNALASRSNRLIGRSCVNCHQQIHGSNSPAGNTLLR
ncbi:MAG TPA: DmsE family decaheme c-type cytochrome [Vicinamibacterales bacterium]|jgi:DmsE family decaheme c-type cytochrome